MVAYSFQKRFGPPILAGTKAQTIRGERKRHACVGERVQLYTGMRTKHCRRLGESVCTGAHRIIILLPRGRARGAIVFKPAEGNVSSPIASATLRDEISLDAFARRDGFSGFDDLVAFWRENHPGVDTFEGVLIRWQPLVAVDPLDTGVAP